MQYMLYHLEWTTQVTPSVQKEGLPLSKEQGCFFPVTEGKSIEAQRQVAS